MSGAGKPGAPELDTGTLDVLGSLIQEHGLLVVLLLLISALFWNLIWKVWHAAMKSKDDEIKRLVKERDKYQKLVFENLLSSDQEGEAK